MLAARYSRFIFSPAGIDKMNKLSINEYEVLDPIAPGTKRPFRITPGNYFYISAASHPNFRLLLNDSTKLKGRLARGYLFPENEQVEKVEVINLSATQPLTLTFEIGRGRPLDEGLNVYTEQVTPTVRPEVPSVFAAVASVACTGLANPLPVLATTDCLRSEIRLFTNDGGVAYYGPTPDTTWPTCDGNQVGASLDGHTRLNTCAPVYVRGNSGTTVYAYVFTHSA